MAKYIKNRFNRFKQLNDIAYELLISRGDISFKPGSALDIYRPDIDQTRSYLIASGMQEPWIRVLVSIYDPWFKYYNTLKPNDSLRVLPELEEKLSNLFSVHKDDIVICENLGISLYLSYLSTFISEEELPTLIYYHDGHPVNLEYIQGRQNVISGDDIDDLLSEIPESAKRYFIISSQGTYNIIESVLPDDALIFYTDIS